MFERFSDGARRAVVHAQEESRSLGHDRIGVEHVLLGLLHEDSAPADAVLGAFGLTLAAGRSAVAAAVGASEHTSARQIPFTPRAKLVLEKSLQAAQRLQHTFIGPGHLLLGLLGEDQGVAADILARHGVDPEEAGHRVLAAIAARGEVPLSEVMYSPRRDAVTGANARARELAEQLGQAQAAKDAALDAGDFAAATAMRARERALIAERDRLITELRPGGQTPPPAPSPE
ncbi:Clp protease N-terminal domain-containing protein [Frankia sp. AvcI1]|uniref:Clp protease N-terminal domain-containing protein n=1 Tax=Frankia sp. AvcI1 TaxID=573496 RepID=UPI000BA467AD|nr:Clp protease N-terminal domain-containing protein [Frankia sp. AvcI1]